MTIQNLAERVFLADSMMANMILSSKTMELALLIHSKMQIILFNECDALIKAVNGLSTKNDMGYIKRGTGLNNTSKIVVNGFKGEILIMSVPQHYT